MENNRNSNIHHWLRCFGVLFGAFLSSVWTYAEDRTVRKEIYTMLESLAVKVPLQLEWIPSADSCWMELKGEGEILERIELHYRPEHRTLALTWSEPMQVKRREVPLLVLHHPPIGQIWVEGEGNVYIGKMELSQIELVNSGKGTLSIEYLKADTLHLYTMEEGAISVETCECAYLQALNRSSGTVAIAGYSFMSRLLNQGKGVINAAELTSNYVQALTQGSGPIYCHVVNYLEGQTEHEGDIFYTGHPKLKKTRNGSGRIMLERDNKP